MISIVTWRYIWIGCILFCAMNVQAMTVDAQIRNGQFRWISAQSSFDGGVAPSIWATPQGLVPTSQFVPGASLMPSVNINFVGPAGASVPFTLMLKGMEYNSPEAISQRGDDGGGGAAISFLSGLIQVSGTGLAKSQVLLNKEVTPFTHARPIFSLGDSAAIVQAFSDANARQGTYLTQVSIPVVYEYFRQGVRIRYNWSVPLVIQIDYTPSVLTDIKVNSPTLGVMTPKYYTSGGVKTVQGEAVFNGVATGVFTNGLRIKLKTGETYQMEAAVSGPLPVQIPYSVICSGCDNPELVVNGTASPGMTTTGTRVAGGNVNIISFSIQVHFADVELSSLQTGAYRDQFTLLFEPEV